MANIAYVRSFNGTSDWIRLNVADYNGISPNAITILAILKSTTDPGESAYRDIVTVSGGSGGQWGALLNNGVGVTPGLAWYIEGGDGFEAGNYYQASDGWALVGFGRPAGANQTARLHKYFYGTATWTHANTAAGLTDAGNAPSGTPTLRIGSWNGSIEFFAGEMAVVGIWLGTNLSDGNVETLEADIASWEALSPTGLWLFDQSSVSTLVPDRTGNGDEVERSGTTVVAPSGLTFDVGGAAPAATRSGMTLLGVG